MCLFVDGIPRLRDNKIWLRVARGADPGAIQGGIQNKAGRIGKPGKANQNPDKEALQGAFCRRKRRHRNTDPKIGPKREESNPETQGQRPKPPKSTETQGPCPDLRRF